MIDVPLVRGLVAAQFPAWAKLSIEEVQPNGHDNRTFRLGSDLSVRLPSHERYVAQVEKEHEWLPKLAPQLPLQIPLPVALGAPASSYPWPWSVYAWIEGETALAGRIADHECFAAALAGFLRSLHMVRTQDGPAAGPHNFFRGGSLSVYDSETRTALDSLGDQVDQRAVTRVWERALQSSWDGDAVWVHGDLAATNLLVRHGTLVAVIDFGCAGVGDPACDLAVSWTMLDGPSRITFREHLDIDEETWSRARGWTLWKALKTLAAHPREGADPGRKAKRVIDAVVAEHKAVT